MAVITAIKPQKKKNRVNIFLDGKFGFGLDLENFVNLGLKVGQELTEIETEEIKNKAEFQKAYNNLLNFAIRRPRSEKEVTDWFYRKKTPRAMQKALKEKLYKFGFLDDTVFAKWWVEQRLEFKSKSRRELIQELRMKGIDKEIIENVLSEADVDELSMAKKELGKRMYKWKSLDSNTRKRKMGEFLGRKGFGWDVIKKAIKPNEIDQ